jgi:hypothetical protein
LPLQDLAIHQLCKVKENGWDGMDSSGSAVTTNPASKVSVVQMLVVPASNINAV